MNSVEPLRLRRYDDVTTFYQRAEPYMLAHEAAHCLPLGLRPNLSHRPADAAPPYLAVVEHADAQIAAVIMRTPPYHVIFSLLDDPASQETVVALAADDLRQTFGELSGALGFTELAAAFAARWQALTGQQARIGRHERIFQLDQVAPVVGVPGRMRRTTPADRDLLVRWHAAFHAEAEPDSVEPPAEADADRMLAEPPEHGGGYLWEDANEVVSLAGYHGPTPHGIRVGPVYTPPERRGRGYASACVAALSQLLLDEGRRYLFLFTDLANPTSNHIYQTIGYRPVLDTDEYLFAPAPVPS